MYKNKLIEVFTEYYHGILEIPLAEHHCHNFQIPQNIEEILQVLERLGERKFNHFVELGIAHGGSLWIYSHMLCKPNSKITAIDPSETPEQRFTCNKLKQRYKNFIRIKGYSEKVIKQVSGDIDLLHIDADHKFDSVLRDFHQWFPKVISGGVILMHDTQSLDGPKRVLERVTREQGELGISYIFNTQACSPLGITLIKK